MCQTLLPCLSFCYGECGHLVIVMHIVHVTAAIRTMGYSAHDVHCLMTAGLYALGAL